MSPEAIINNVKRDSFLKRFGGILWYETELCCFVGNGIRKGTGRKNVDVFCDRLYLLTKERTNKIVAGKNIVDFAPQL